MNSADVNKIIKSLNESIKSDKLKDLYIEVSPRYDLVRKKKKIPSDPSRQVLNYRRKKYKQFLKNKKKRKKHDNY